MCGTHNVPVDSHSPTLVSKGQGHSQLQEGMELVVRKRYRLLDPVYLHYHLPHILLNARQHHQFTNPNPWHISTFTRDN